ncbi:glycosyltransferase family 2 protein [Streptomyces sp. ACA25]|uniref:glycosyltransferase family 2 protein n=1 Tax=Streptomyces sp. ACA25 TaxID=3022596 RepID=UPI003FA71073
MNMVPDVTVILPVYNSMPYLTECLTSIASQSLGEKRIEVVAINDASTDESGDELDRYAVLHPGVRVIHRSQGSGGPSVPRNQGLDVARGRYIFFADADDILGVEALERLVRMADSHDSDVVLGKMIGWGRGVSVKAFRHATQADLFTSEVNRSLGPQKLFRRQLIEKEGLRFREDVWFGEDQIFSTSAYLAASGISVVGDYDCYYLRHRDDGGNITLRRKSVDELVGHTEICMEIIDNRVSSVYGRNRMIARHFRAMLDRSLRPALAHTDRDYQDQVWDRCLAMYHKFWHKDMLPEVTALHVVLLHCLSNSLKKQARLLAQDRTRVERSADLVENGRVYRCFPFFRDPALRIPDSVFEVTGRLKARASLEDARWSGDNLVLTGYGYIDRVDTRDVRTTLVMRERSSGRQVSQPTQALPSPDVTVKNGKGRWDYGFAGWKAKIDLASMGTGGPLSQGVWDAYLLISAQGVVKERRLPCPKVAASITMPSGRKLRVGNAEAVAVVPYETKSGRFSVDIGGTLRPIVPGGHVTSVSWHGNSLRIVGLGWLSEVSTREVSMRVILRRRTKPGRGGLRTLLGGRFRKEMNLSTRLLSAHASLSTEESERAHAQGFLATLQPLGSESQQALSSGVWDVYLQVSSQDVVEEVRLRGVKTLSEEHLWRVRLLKARRGMWRSCTAYLTKAGYAAIDSGGQYFLPAKQLLLCRPVGDGTAGTPRVVTGRIGPAGHSPDALRMEFLRSGKVFRSISVSPSLAGEGDSIPEHSGPERNLQRWPMFRSSVPEDVISSILASANDRWSVRLRIRENGMDVRSSAVDLLDTVEHALTPSGPVAPERCSWGESGSKGVGLDPGETETGTSSGDHEVSNP